MSYEDAEKVLRKAFTLYAKQGPQQKKEIQAALDVLLETMNSASAIASECQKAIQTCLLLINKCPLSTAETS